LDENVAALWVWLNYKKTIHLTQTQSVRVKENKITFVGHHCRDITRSEDKFIFYPCFLLKSLRFEL